MGICVHLAPLMEAIAPPAINTLSEFIPHELVATVWAFAARAVPHYPLLEAIAAKSIPRSTAMEWWHLATTVWAFDVLISHNGRRDSGESEGNISATTRIINFAIPFFEISAVSM